MDPTLMPVRLTDAHARRWRAHVLAGTDEATARADLAERLNITTAKPLESLRTQLSRFLSGDGKQVVGWLSPSNARGSALLGVLHHDRASLVRFLEGLLMPPRSFEVLREGDLVDLPITVRGPLLVDAAGAFRHEAHVAVREGRWSGLGREREDHPWSSWREVLARLRAEYEGPIPIHLRGRRRDRDRLRGGASRLRDPLVVERGRGAGLPLEVLGVTPAAVRDWILRLRTRGCLDEAQATRVREVFGLEGTELAWLDEVDPPSLLGLVEDAATGRLTDARPVSIRASLAAWHLGRLGHRVDERTAAWLRGARPFLTEWLRRTGRLDEPLPLLEVRDMMRARMEQDSLTLLNEALLALASASPDVPALRARLARGLGLELMDELITNGLLVATDDALRLSEEVQQLGSFVIPLELEPDDMPWLCTSGEGLRLLSQAVAIAPQVDPWLEAAWASRGPGAPLGGVAVLEGLAARPGDGDTARLRRVWTTTLWRLVHGWQDESVFDGFRGPVHELSRVSGALRHRLPDLDAADPYASFREMVAPEVVHEVATWRAEPVSEGDRMAEGTIMSAAIQAAGRAGRFGSRTEAAAALCVLAPYQIPAVLLSRWGSFAIRIDHHARIWAHRAEVADPEARRWALRDGRPTWGFPASPTWQEALGWLAEDLEVDLAVASEWLATAAAAGADASQPAILRVLTKRPALLEDGDLAGAVASPRSVAHDVAKERLPFASGAVARFARSVKRLWTGADVLALAEKLRRVAALQFWADPPVALVEWMAVGTMEVDERRCTLEWGSLEELAAWRFEARCALARLGLPELLRESAERAWAVDDPLIASQRKAFRALQQVVGEYAVESLPAVDGATRDALVCALAGGTDTSVEAAVDRLAERAAWRKDRVVSANDARALAHVPTERFWSVLRAWVQEVFPTGPGPVQAWWDALPLDLAADGRWEHDARTRAERELILLGDRPTQARFLATHGLGKPPPGIPSSVSLDPALADALWSDLSQPVKQMVLERLKPGELTLRWWHRARRHLPLQQCRRLASRSGSPGQRAAVARETIEGIETPWARLDARLDATDLALDSKAEPDVRAGLLAAEADGVHAIDRLVCLKQLTERADEGIRKVMGEDFNRFVQDRLVAVAEALAQSGDDVRSRRRHVVTRALEAVVLGLGLDEPERLRLWMAIGGSDEAVLEAWLSDRFLAGVRWALGLAPEPSGPRLEGPEAAWQAFLAGSEPDGKHAADPLPAEDRVAFARAAIARGEHSQSVTVGRAVAALAMRSADVPGAGEVVREALAPWVQGEERSRTRAWLYHRLMFWRGRELRVLRDWLAGWDAP